MTLFFCVLDFTKLHHITLECRVMNAIVITFQLKKIVKTLVDLYNVLHLG